MTMRSLLFIAGLAAVAATQVPAYMERFVPQEGSDSKGTMLASTAPQSPVPEVIAGGTATLTSNRGGHYNGDFRINGRTVQGIVDTGASLVSIPESVARRLGYDSSALDYRYPVGTANGQTKGALIKLDRIEIGQVRVRNVDALVLKDEALSATLIGMTFLNQLSSYKVESGRMRLTN